MQEQYTTQWFQSQRISGRPCADVVFCDPSMFHAQWLSGILLRLGRVFDSADRGNRKWMVIPAPMRFALLLAVARTVAWLRVCIGAPSREDRQNRSEWTVGLRWSNQSGNLTQGTRRVATRGRMAVRGATLAHLSVRPFARLGGRVFTGSHPFGRVMRTMRSRHVNVS